MRSVIINTLGAAYSRKDVYFLAFDPDRILWLDAELDQLHDCVQLILDDRQSRTEFDDYQLFVLMGADGFEGAAYDDHAQRINTVLRAWMVWQLLRPLDEQSFAPVSATGVIVNNKHRDSATAPIRDYCGMLHLDASQLPQSITLPFVTSDGQQHALDLTQMLSDALEAVGQPEPGPAQETVNAQNEKRKAEHRMFEEDEQTDAEVQQDATELRRKNADRLIGETVNALQDFRLLRAADREMLIGIVDFRTELQDKTAINADLQLNLARLLQKADTKGLPDASAIRCHIPSELAQLLADAEATLRAQRDPVTPQKIYYPLNGAAVTEDDAAKLKVEIRQRLLKEAADVPGVNEALKKPDEQSDSIDLGIPAPEDSDGLAAQVRSALRGGMLSVIRERRLFRERYEELRTEYNREKVLDDQRKVFDICAGGYTEWRAEERRKRPARSTEPSEHRRPVLETEKSAELIAARERCAGGVLSQLNDFTDVRQEAAKLHTEFSSLTRLWSPESVRDSTKYFYRFSVVMGIIFVILMILPFFLISGQAADLKMSRFVAYLINSAVFVVLYAAGFLLWLRKLAKEIRELRGQLELLILKSEEARRQSVLCAIEMYTKDLPDCVIAQLNYTAMEETDRLNAENNRKYEQHMRYMENAIRELSDVRTALRTQGFNVTGKASPVKLDLLRAPYSSENQAFYMLFTERGEPADDGR